MLALSSGASLAPCTRRDRSSSDADDATLALERALADARERARASATRVCELESALSSMSVRAKRAEARAGAMGERLARARTAASEGGETAALRRRCEALEEANARLKMVWKEKSERVDELEGALEASRRAVASVDANAESESGRAERAERREREIVRLRRELSRQAQVIADAYRDEVTRLQRELQSSEALCETLRSENEALRADADATRPRKSYESPYVYAKFSSKKKVNASSPSRGPLTPRPANESTPRRESVFDRLATPKRISMDASPARSPSLRTVR